MAELISFVVPTQSDKVLLAWELSAGPPAEALSVRVRAEGEGAGITGGQEPPARADGGAQRTESQRGILSPPRLSRPKSKPCVQGRSALPMEKGGIWVWRGAEGSALTRGPPTAFCVHSVFPVWPSVFSPSLPERCSGRSWFLRHHQVLLLEGRAESPKGMRRKAPFSDITSEGVCNCRIQNKVPSSAVSKLEFM